MPSVPYHEHSSTPWSVVIIASALAFAFAALAIYLFVRYRRKQRVADARAMTWEQRQWDMTQASPQPIVTVTSPTPATFAAPLPPTLPPRARARRDRGDSMSFQTDSQRALAGVMRSAPPPPQWGTRPPRRGRESWRFGKGVAGPSGAV